jgi:hypothetical protein
LVGKPAAAIAWDNNSSSISILVRIAVAPLMCIELKIIHISGPAQPDRLRARAA